MSRALASEESAAPGIVASLWRYRWQSILIVLLISAASVGATAFTSSAVTASTDVALTYPSAINVLSPGVSGDASLARYTQQRAAFATSDDVLQLVIQKVPGISLSQLRKDITVSPSAVANVITIIAEAENAEAATNLANAAADAYRDATDAKVTAITKAALASYTARRREIESRLPRDNNSPQAQAAATALSQIEETTANLQTDSKAFGDGVDFTRRAQVQDAEVPGPPIRQLALGIVIGMLIAAVVAWLRADRDRKITDVTRPAQVLEAPLLAQVPKYVNGRPAHAFGRSGAAEQRSGFEKLPHPQYRLAAAVLVRKVSPGLMAVLGPPDVEDRSEGSLNLAVAVTNDGGRVLIVDADPKGTLTRRLDAGAVLEGFQMSVDPIVTDRLTDTITEVSIQDGVSIALMTPGPYAFVNSPADLRALVEKLVGRVEEFDLIIVDCPSVESSPLVPAILRACAGVLAVVPRGSQERDIAEIRRTADIFSNPILGFVYTGARSRRSSSTPR
jgi:succinoglycan biosynthesis transport protein ExoP